MAKKPQQKPAAAPHPPPPKPVREYPGPSKESAKPMEGPPKPAHPSDISAPAPAKSTPPEPQEICLSCRFFITFPEGDGGRCRYYPPVVAQALPRDRSTVRYPQVDYNGWCGRWEFNK